MNNSLYGLRQQLADIQAIDFFLARQLINSLDIIDSELLFYSVMALSEALREGHSCLLLSEYAGRQRWADSAELKTGYQFPDLDSWHDYLSSLKLTEEEGHPLVYECQRLYLRRYWTFETELAEKINTFIESETELDINTAQRVLEQLFAGADSHSEPDWQMIAVANSLLHTFSLITGGPGTGKTYTVTKLLSALQILSDRQLRIAMVAPTGKAAQRLNESIHAAKVYLLKENPELDVTLDAIPDSASTVHRLLGYLSGSHNFKYDNNRLLPYDVILVDEISMIDLPLMARLFRAVNSCCRVILLGDADQLPSVAAGSILSDLAPCKLTSYSQKNATLISKLTGFELNTNDSLYDYLTVLQKSRRFDSCGEIGQLAGRVIDGGSLSSWQLLEQGQKQIALNSADSFELWLKNLLDIYYKPLFTDQSLLSVDEAFSLLNKFCFLCAVRQNEHSVTHINTLTEQYLKSQGLITITGEYYPGRPVMVVENHYASDLFNGDVGLLWLNEQGKLQAVFPQSMAAGKHEQAVNNKYRWLSIGRLPRVETVYAMTIHKSQGSEFTHVALVLPEKDSPVLSRELLYTGITRAKERLDVYSHQSVWENTVRRRVQRFSGLALRVTRELK